MADTPPLQSDPNAPVFTIEKLYVKDLSVENPNAPQSYLWREAPSVEVTLDHESTPIEEGFYNVLIKATVTATIADRTLFLVEGALGGIFQIRNIAQADLAPVLGVHCPNILFPYLREVISDAVNRMGYPSIYLQPVNFEAIYQARLQREIAQQAAAGGPATLQ